MMADNPVGSGFFFPFGRGPRMCIGHQFAVFFIKQTLAEIVRRCDVVFPSGQNLQQSFFFGVMIPQGLSAGFRTHSN